MEQQTRERVHDEEACQAEIIKYVNSEVGPEIIMLRFLLWDRKSKMSMTRRVPFIRAIM